MWERIEILRFSDQEKLGEWRLGLIPAFSLRIQNPSIEKLGVKYLKVRKTKGKVPAVRLELSVRSFGTWMSYVWTSLELDSAMGYVYDSETGLPFFFPNVPREKVLSEWSKWIPYYAGMIRGARRSAEWIREHPNHTIEEWKQWIFDESKKPDLTESELNELVQRVWQLPGIIITYYCV